MLALLLTACTAETDSTDSTSRDSPPEVPVRTVQTDAATVARTYAGRTAGAREVEVRARVDGILERRSYSEGDQVEEGDVLFRVDARRYEVRVQRAEADVARAEAEVRQAEREWNRVASLYEDDALSERERDQARSALELAEAGLALAEAEVADARIDLDYTTVEAPIAGVAGLSEHPEGSLVDPGTLLTTVTQLNPIEVRFAIPEAQVNTFGPQIHGGSNIQVAMTLPDGEGYPHTGELDFTESAVDPATGTVRARAVFPNPESQLVPGQFVRITLSGLFMGLVIQIPHEAVAQDDDGSYVFIVDDDNRVHRRGIALGPDMGDEVIIADGLEDGDRVLVSGAPDLEEKTEVTPMAEPAKSDAQRVPDDRERLAERNEAENENTGNGDTR